MIRQAAAALLLVAGLVGTPAPAAARAAGGLPGYCPDDNGVTVVVDFNELGGDTIVRCAVGSQATGLTALENAGFLVEGTKHWGKAFVCRLQGKPGADTEPCLDTPPANAYWSYWHAPNGGSWTYSQQGVAARKPPLGSFEGWSFAKDKAESSLPRPGVAPQRPITTPPTTKKPAPVITTTGPPAPGVTEEAPSATPAVPSESPSASPSEPPPSWTGNLAEPPATKRGLPIATIAGAAVVALVIAAGAVTAYRRRRPGPDAAP